MFAGLGACKVIWPEPKTSPMLIKIFGCARVREGHPTPPAFAMQTRHVFLYFLITNMVYLQTVGENPRFQA